jgi:hypothetical protein
MPMVAETDRDALELALRGAGCRDISQARVIRIRDTLHLGDVLVSDALLEQCRRQSHVQVDGERREACDGSGALLPL